MSFEKLIDAFLFKFSRFLPILAAAPILLVIMDFLKFHYHLSITTSFLPFNFGWSVLFFASHSPYREEG